MDAARGRARQYLKALPVRDRVMLVRAAGMATPATAFELDRRKIEDAIRASEPGATALNLDQALLFARHIQGQDGHRAGEIAFIGPGRTAPRDPGLAAMGVESLYTRALLMGHHKLRAADLAALDRSFLGLLDRAMGSDRG